jgi:hypothetical protein
VSSGADRGSGRRRADRYGAGRECEASLPEHFAERMRAALAATAPEDADPAAVAEIVGARARRFI